MDPAGTTLSIAGFLLLCAAFSAGVAVGLYFAEQLRKTRHARTNKDHGDRLSAEALTSLNLTIGKFRDDLATLARDVTELKRIVHTANGRDRH